MTTFILLCTQTFLGFTSRHKYRWRIFPAHLNTGTRCNLLSDVHPRYLIRSRVLGRLCEVAWAFLNYSSLAIKVQKGCGLTYVDFASLGVSNGVSGIAAELVNFVIGS